MGPTSFLLGLSSFSNGSWDCCPHQNNFIFISNRLAACLVQSFYVIFQEPVERRFGVFIHGADGGHQTEYRKASCLCEIVPSPVQRKRAPRSLAPGAVHHRWLDYPRPARRAVGNCAFLRLGERIFRCSSAFRRNCSRPEFTALCTSAALPRARIQLQERLLFRVCHSPAARSSWRSITTAVALSKSMSPGSRLSLRRAGNLRCISRIILSTYSCAFANSRRNSPAVFPGVESSLPPGLDGISMSLPLRGHFFGGFLF